MANMRNTQGPFKQWNQQKKNRKDTGRIWAVKYEGRVLPCSSLASWEPQSIPSYVLKNDHEGAAHVDFEITNKYSK